MILAKRAAVRPHVCSVQGGEPLLLETEIRAYLDEGARGVIVVLGGAGAGKTTALRHLAAVLPPNETVAFVDEPDHVQATDVPRQSLAICAVAVRTVAKIAIPADQVAASDALVARTCAPLATYVLEDWDKDDLIEYLLNTSREQCASVMERIQPSDFRLLGGLPELWQVVLDRLAGNDSLPDARSALHCWVGEHLGDTDLLERACSACLNALLASDATLSNTLERLARPGFAAELMRVLRHPSVQMLLAAERLAADLHGDSACDGLAKRLPRELLGTTATLITEDERARDHLHRLLIGPEWSHAMAVSLLHALGDGATVRNHPPTRLAGAYLEGIAWPGVHLVKADLTEVDLSNANLTAADLTGAQALLADFSRADLRDACLQNMLAEEADFTAARLSGAHGEGADFSAASLVNADLSDAAFPGASFEKARLIGANFRDARLERAQFTEAELTDADFSNADLTEAVLYGQRLGKAHWEGAQFACAVLKKCDLEYLDLPLASFEKADLKGALLTGSRMRDANFKGARLCDAGLADVEWYGADLRGADLRGASFHMGSSRSGLVGSPLACEGSRTGFYTDDYDEQTYKAPEEIRKANLCGADLRGAILDGVDFYLVDLRGALYDAAHENHLRRCGAILETRV